MSVSSPPVASAAPAAPRRTGLPAVLTVTVSRFGLLLILAVAIAVFSGLKPQTFPTADNFTAIAGTYALTLMLALSVVLPLAVGEFDLSVAATFGLCHVLTAGLVLESGQSIFVAAGVALAAGAAIGLVNGLLVVRFKVSSFVATLGTMTILGGVTQGYAPGGQILAEPHAVGGGHTAVYAFPAWFLNLGEGELLGIAGPFWVALALVVVLWFVLDRTTTGRRLTATGGNREAAHLSGVNTDRTVLLTFVACGLLAAVAGVVATAQLGRGLTTIADSYLLPAYAGAFLGATTVRPGRFNAWGTLVGVYLVAICVAGLQQLGVQDWVQSVFNGGALIVAVVASGFLARLLRRRPARRPTPSKEAA
jgi:ribose transport system permease protein